MNFKLVSIEDKSLLEPYLFNNPYGICNYSFANLFIWKDVFNDEICIHKDHLIIRTSTVQGKTAYLMPLDNGRKKVSKNEVLNDMIAEAKVKGEEFRLFAVTPKMEEELNQLKPGAFEFHNPADFCDYIYLSENLRLLTGKKYHAKRNHINKFLSLYNGRYEYVEITEDNIYLCHEMSERWRMEREIDATKLDYCAVSMALNNWSKLEVSGGALLVDGEMVAFTIGQPNNADTFNVIIEKALGHIEGAYSVINKEFALRNCEKYLYINREEDLGMEGLRRAKLSYNPHLLLMKSEAVLKQ